jgi:exodeoxyribonuclease VII small subunit
MEETKKEDKQSLEMMFQQLDVIVTRMEGEDLNLDESFSLYQKGMQMLKLCNERLDLVEKQVQVLDENGEVHEF